MVRGGRKSEGEGEGRETGGGRRGGRGEIDGARIYIMILCLQSSEYLHSRNFSI